ncbi:MAG: recombination mediator RecR [Bacteroidales bacterium]|nr:recombination mediator RecR [Bacteroidales bacterium]
MEHNIPSRLVENAVHELSRLPGIGKKTALRLALHLLQEDTDISTALGNAIIKMREDIVYCQKCHNISDNPLCHICSSASRDAGVVCVVRDVRDVMAIENTAQFNGLYHVLGGIISPMEGVGPQDLTIESLIKRIREDNTRELVLALPSTVEGDTTGFYIVKQIHDLDIKISSIARGIGVGDELEYADEVTLGRSIKNRVPWDNS